MLSEIENMNFHEILKNNKIIPVAVFNDMNNALKSAELLLKELLQAIELWEERITVLENEIELDILPEQNAITIVLPYRINVNGLIAIFSKKVVI